LQYESEVNRRYNNRIAMRNSKANEMIYWIDY
jgi:hypothetical protein